MKTKISRKFIVDCIHLLMGVCSFVLTLAWVMLDWGMIKFPIYIFPISALVLSIGGIKLLPRLEVWKNQDKI